MSETTDFAGLTALLPGEPLDAAFLGGNIRTIDRILRVGAVTHRHDGHARLDDPPQGEDTGPALVIETVGGTIPADLGIYVGYTWVDADGGETILSEASLISTEPGLEAPTTAPVLELDHAAGGLLANTYTYGVTVSDGLGGETPLGATEQITVPPGFATSQVLITGLTDILTDTGGTEWRLYRARGAGNFTYLTSGSGDAVTDDNTLCPQCDQTPPLVGSTANTNVLKVTLPAVWPTGVASLRLYASIDGSFVGPSLLGTYLPADEGTEQTFTALSLQEGQPPTVNLSLPGADKIDPDTEMLDFPWKRPVANAAALPVADNEAGDVRETLDDHALHAWDGAAWVSVGGGGATSLPIDEVGGDTADIPVWTKDGVPVLWLRGHQSTDDEAIVTEEFTGGAGTIGDGYARDGAGNAIPEAGSNDTNAIRYSAPTPAWANLYDGYVERTFTVASANWTRIGVTLGTARTGLFAWVTAAGDLVIATRTVDSNLEADFTVIATDPLPAAPGIGDTFNIQLDRVGNHLHATVHQAKAVVAEAEIDIPVPLQADFGSGVSLEAGLADRWTNPDAWTTDFLHAVWHHYKRELTVFALMPGGTTTSHLLMDGVGDQFFNFGSQVTGGYSSADWADDATWPASWLREGHGSSNTKLSGRAVKSAGVAPVSGDVIASLDVEARPYSDQLVPVVTGDDDGEELGIILIDTAGDVTWLAGRSTAPAVKHPYVCFDGVPAYPTI